MDHGYNRYAAGCHCQVCRDAKAAYMREKRGEARRRAALLPPGVPMIVEGIKHGPTGYRDHRCRCFTCRQGAHQAKVNAAAPGPVRVTGAESFERTGRVSGSAAIPGGTGRP